MCSEWFDYTNGCYDDTCNGIARMSLTSEAVSWMNSNGYSSNATAAKFCTISAPWPLSRTTPLLQVKLVCQQICDYCLPSTTTSTSTSTTTETNRRKIMGNISFKLVNIQSFPLKLCLPLPFYFFLSVCPNGNYQTNVDYAVCSTWFDINKCDDSTCDTTPQGYQTRCNLNTEAVSVLTPMNLGTAGAICDEDGPGGLFRLHQTVQYLPTWSVCPWCCNWCNSTATIGKMLLLQ